MGVCMVKKAIFGIKLSVLKQRFLKYNALDTQLKQNWDNCTTIFYVVFVYIFAKLAQFVLHLFVLHQWMYKQLSGLLW